MTTSVLIYKAALLYDDGNDPIAAEGETRDFLSHDEAVRWARRVLSYSLPIEAGWYVSMERGHYIDPHGTGIPGAFEFEPDTEWSDTVYDYGQQQLLER